jgi:hypothetical protein
VNDAIRNLFIWLENALSVEVACAYPDLNFRTPYRHVELDSTAQKWGMEGNPEFDWREPRDSNCGLPVTSSTRDALISRRVPSELVNGAAINHVPHVPKAPAQGTAQPSQNGILLSG